MNAIKESRSNSPETKFLYECDEPVNQEHLPTWNAEKPYLPKCTNQQSKHFRHALVGDDWRYHGDTRDFSLHFYISTIGKNTDMKESKFIERPVDPTRKRYYLVSGDSGRARAITDIEILNKDTMIGEFDPTKMNSFTIYSGFDENGNILQYTTHFGMPTFREMPIIKIASKSTILDVYRFQGRIFVSPRVKKFLEETDPEAFQFQEAETYTRNKKRLESYWMMVVRRVVEEFDEKNSIFRYVHGQPSTHYPKVNNSITSLYDIRMRPEIPDQFHAFYLLQCRGNYIFDEVIVDEWRNRKFNSLIFSPLQPPLKHELKSDVMVSRYKNWDFFFEKMRYKWEDLTK